ncbi:MAG: hypothetical protein P3B98_13350 [Gemmatimonadota bacterium]|nr:hypothetical protein [Gemmatimonadota bacterium]
MPVTAGQAHRALQRAIAVAALLFGVATIVAGGAVLGGRDPGYLVYKPLLLFNTGMGAVYVAAGALAWRRLTPARHASAAILVLNIVALGGVIWLYRTDGAVAMDSVRAMIFRTGVWLVLWLGLAWLNRAPRGPA